MRRPYWTPVIYVRNAEQEMLPSAAITLGQLQQPPQVQLQQQQVRQVAEGLSQSLSVVIEDATDMEAAVR